jgi:hypothetical protein
MSTPPFEDDTNHSSGLTLSGPHAFVRSSMKSVIKALSGRRQSPSPTFRRSSSEVVGSAERTDRDFPFDERIDRLLSATDGSEMFPPTGPAGTVESMESKPEIRLGLDESGVDENVLSKLSKIRSLYGNIEGRGNMENPDQEVRSDSQRLRFHMDERLADGSGLGQFASYLHSPQTPSSPVERRNEELKGSGEVRGGRLPGEQDRFGSRSVPCFDAELAFENKSNGEIRERDSLSAARD